MTATNHDDTHERPLRLDSTLLEPDQAAELLAVRTSWIYEAVRTSRLPCLRIGRHIRFTREMLEQACASGRRRRVADRPYRTTEWRLLVR